MTDSIVTVHVWRVRPSSLPAVLGSLPLELRAIRALPGIRFAKVLGSSRGFRMRDADILRWVLLASWSSRQDAADFQNTPAASRWEARAAETWRATLKPLWARGRWSGREPFGQPAPTNWDGPVAALTRARIAPRHLPTFWRAVPPVAAAANSADGLLVSMGIGEAPVGVQGTFTVWRDASALAAFAHAGAAHREAVHRTATVGWYTEESFSRFAVLGSYGTIDGCDPLSGPA